MQVHLTVEQIGQCMGLRRGEAYALATVLRTLGVAPVVGQRKKEGHKGKAADVYFVDTDRVIEMLTGLVRKLESVPAAPFRPLDTAPESTAAPADLAAPKPEQSA